MKRIYTSKQNYILNEIGLWKYTLKEYMIIDFGLSTYDNILLMQRLVKQ